ncbi:nucleotide disphospho-sugar-binding domain-containing protein [Leptolyngbya sp. FACHB-261]|uniref:glycosyltransferase n=1 Tax=Leptolyngbya sp. FACHB-261 TaxID=2692806 RepID=UPI0016867E00|nr:nucleotide disphospho-sugar-binding domain-containing protein [Leptolyngbya sp. FACHB-261]MBD2099650.1 glycosyltransferase family 1 protein [Leptolyngbya sp. FACHB-261]
MGRRIVLATVGSFGDLHPYLAIALELKARGHQPIIVTTEFYRTKIEAEGLEFHPMRPNISPEGEQSREWFKRSMDAQRGTEYVVRELFLPHLRDSYEDMKSALQNGADLVVTHPLTWGARLLAEKRGLPWVSSVLAPISFTSAYDPSILPTSQGNLSLRGLPPWFNRPLLKLGKLRFHTWTDPIRQLRAELGLPPLKTDPLFEGQHSPDLVLALFSELLGAPQPDWPPHTCVTGFAFYDRHGAGGLAPDLAEFLAAGPAPIVFTLGSSAVLDPGKFYIESATAAEQLGRRAVLLVGNNGPDVLPSVQSKNIAVFDYAPYSELFPQAAAIVHQGGVGTTAQAMRSGRPMLVVPYSHDQPDNAARVSRLGIARSLARQAYTASRVAVELNQLLNEPRYSQRAAEIGCQIQAENGAHKACDALEAYLAGRATSNQPSEQKPLPA